MTAVHDPSLRFPREGTLAPVLRAAHEAWLREMTEYLLPLTERGASFWDRWTTVRYLADQFRPQYRRECAVVQELRPFLPHEVAERLVQQGLRIGGLQEAIDQVGRKHGTARTVLVISRGLLASLRDWCRD